MYQIEVRWRGRLKLFAYSRELEIGVKTTS
jgi:hypothetical protein